MRGKERSYFQILNETTCVAQAYKRLSGQAAEGMGRTESKARLEKEFDCLRQSMSKTKHSKARSEPIGIDCSDCRYWVLKKDPNFIFTQVESLRCLYIPELVLLSLRVTFFSPGSHLRRRTMALF
jgi:hypothetical protein